MQTGRDGSCGTTPSGPSGPSGDQAVRPEVVDGGDRGCGELLMVLAARGRALPPGTTIRLLATDPAAPIDLPAWCHLTGHDYLGRGVDPQGRPHYDIRLSGIARRTQDAHPWRLDPRPPTTTHREEHP